ncbi:diguanylate cyclase [Marinicauda algicola]|uniref:diguanylate cyclase n=2 Tax=Marinicauda algicola TaxID=2029849 RepID=A0A4S2GZK5_9PROT|nr:diguanylate cyclase [Marinicauda algicola]
MVCETSRVQRRILRSMLEDGGFEVREAGDSGEALGALERCPSDIFITGIEVGQMSGLEACWRLKAGADTCHIHTIVITASGEYVRLAEALDAGADDFIRKPFDGVEMKARMRAAARIARLQRDLRGQAETDALTGAANRRAFIRALDREIGEAGRLSIPMAVAMVDLDHFKQINDTHGHASGDRVLVRTVAALKNELGGGELLGRLGGEEFAVLLPRAGTREGLETAERLRRAVEHLRVENDDACPIPVTASFGLTVLQPHESLATGSDLLARADKALYAAKEAGRNRVVTG